MPDENVVSGVSGPAQAHRVPLRVMTQNNFNTVAGVDPEHPSKNWEYRAEYNVGVMRRYRPDVIGFQEFESAHAATYRRDLSGYEQVVANPNRECTAILWRPDRFELLDRGVREMWDHEVPHLTDLEDDLLMSTTWVKLRCRASGAVFVMLSTHLNDVSEGARQAGIDANLRVVNELDPERALPVVMVGDFNCNPWSPVYHRLVESGFVDTYRAAGHADSVDSSTFHGFRGRDYFALEWGASVFWRVDWIMLRPGRSSWRTLSCTIVRDSEPPMFVSDHWGVVTEFITG